LKQKSANDAKYLLISHRHYLKGITFSYTGGDTRLDNFPYLLILLEYPAIGLLPMIFSKYAYQNIYFAMKNKCIKCRLSPDPYGLSLKEFINNSAPQLKRADG
jgi:hypothetical protein